MDLKTTVSSVDASEVGTNARQDAARGGERNSSVVASERKEAARRGQFSQTFLLTTGREDVQVMSNNSSSSNNNNSSSSSSRSSSSSNSSNIISLCSLLSCQNCTPPQTLRTILCQALGGLEASGGIRGEAQSAAAEAFNEEHASEAHSATSSSGQSNQGNADSSGSGRAARKGSSFDETDSRVAPISCKFVVQFCKVLDLSLSQQLAVGVALAESFSKTSELQVSLFSLKGPWNFVMA